MFARARFPEVLGAFLLFLTACSGGSDSGGSVTVSPASLQFEADYGGATPANQVLRISYPQNAAGVLVGFPVDGTVADWIDMEVISQSNPLELAVGVSNTTLPAGAHSATLRIVAVTYDEDVLGYTDVPVTYTIHGKLAASPTALNLLKVLGGEDNGSATISLTGTGGDSFAWNASVTYTSGQDWLSLNGNAQAAGTALPATLDVSTANSLAAGIYQATILLTAEGESLEVPVTYTVREPELVLDPVSLAFGTISGQTALPASQSINVNSETGVALDYAISVNYNTGDSWLNLPATGTSQAPLEVQPGTTELPPGAYSAQIILTPTNGTEAKQLLVTYNVTKSELTIFPTRFDFSVDTTTTTLDITDTAVLDRTGGALNWTATASVPWLSVTPASGTTGSGESVTLSFVLSELDPLAVGTHNVTITFAYEDAYNTKSSLEIPVSLDMRLPLFSVVTPYIAYADRSEEIVIRGQGFLDLAGKSLLIGSNTVADYRIINDTEIRLNHPLLTTERYAITAENELQLARSMAELVVVDVPAFGYAALATSDFTRKLLFDPERQSLYAVKWDYSSANERIDRYTFNGTTWDETTLSLTTARDVAFTSDGKELIALSQDTLHHVDPTSLQITSDVGENNPLDQLMFMNDGSGLLTVGSTWTDLWDYDVATDAFTPIPMGVVGSLYRPRLAASLDRSVVLLGENGSSGDALFRFNPQSGQLSATTHNSSSTYLSVDRIGTHFCIDTKVYDSDFNLLGTLPYFMSVCAPDGTQAHVWDTTNKLVRTFDLTQTNGSGGFVEVGTGIAVPDSHGIYAPTLAISQDGGTLFIGGEQNIIIQPLP